MPNLVLETAPALEPVDRDADLKPHLRLSGTAHDAFLDLLIPAARRQVENDTCRALITQTWKLYLDNFPGSRATRIEFPFAPLQTWDAEICYAKYYDMNEVEQTWSSSLYQVSTYSEPGRLGPISTEVWPLTFDRMDAVEIAFLCGYGDNETDVPEDLRQAIRLLIGGYFQHREPAAFSAERFAVVRGDATYQRLIMPYRMWMF